MPRTITSTYDSIIFARKTIAEIQSNVALNKRVEISANGRKISQQNVFEPLVPQSPALFFGLQSIPVTLTCIASDENFFGNSLDVRSSVKDQPHRKCRGLIVVYFPTPQLPYLEFCIFINQKLCALESEVMLQMRTETFAAEFLSCWLMYEQIREAAKRHSEFDTFSQSLGLFPRFHSEYWGVARLLCPPRRLDSHMREAGLRYGAIEDLSLNEDTEMPPRLDAILKTWEQETRISRDCVYFSMISCVHENRMRWAMRQFSFLHGQKKSLTVTDLEDSMTNTTLDRFWGILREEWFLNTVKGVPVPDWRERLILGVKNAEYWAKVDNCGWGDHFQTSFWIRLLRFAVGRAARL